MDLFALKVLMSFNKSISQKILNGIFYIVGHYYLSIRRWKIQKNLLMLDFHFWLLKGNTNESKMKNKVKLNHDYLNR